MSFFLKKLLIALGITALVIAGYYFIAGKGSGTPASENSSALLIEKSGNVLANTKKINTLKFDTDIFESGAFTSLKETRVDLTPVPSGRTNPFAPIE